jgi:hypothetical protein
VLLLVGTAPGMLPLTDGRVHAERRVPRRPRWCAPAAWERWPRLGGLPVTDSRRISRCRCRSMGVVDQVSQIMLRIFLTYLSDGLPGVRVEWEILMTTQVEPSSTTCTTLTRSVISW